MAAIAFGLFAMHVSNARAGAAVTVVVNSTGNTDDGECTGPPNAGVGNCTLREAIQAANAGQADVINFHSTFFSVATPGVINLESGLGELPTIVGQDTVVIDATGRGVVIEGDGDGDGVFCETPVTAGAQSCQFGLEILATHNGQDFSLIGGGHFVIQNIGAATGLVSSTCLSVFAGGDGIRFVGDESNTLGLTWTGTPPTTAGCLGPVAGPFSAGNVSISGVDLEEIGRHGILFDTLSNLNNVSVTDSIINTCGGTPLSPSCLATPTGDGIRMFADDCPSPKTPTCVFNDNTIAVTGNRILGQDSGVSIDFAGGNDLGDAALINPARTINVMVNDNATITGLSDDGVGVFFGCGSSIVQGMITYEVNGNGPITGGTNGVNLLICADGPDTSDVTTSVSVNDNGPINGSTVAGAAGAGAIAGGGDGDGTAVDVFIQDQNSNSAGEAGAAGIAPINQSTVTVTGNDSITGDDDGVEIDNTICCGNANLSDVSVDSNGEITGQGDDGVDVDVAAGGGAGSSDNNTSIVDVSHNGEINGESDEGVDVDSEANATAGSGNNNTSTVTVLDNNGIQGDDDGVEIDADSGSFCCDAADDNTTSVTVSDNGIIQGGDDDGVDVDADATAGTGDADGNTATIIISGNDQINSDDGSDGVEADADTGSFGSGSADDNTSTVEVTDNGSILGGDDDGVDATADALSFSGDTADDNTATVTVSGNASIRGIDGDGVEADARSGNLCCDAANDNQSMVNVNDNGDITGRDDGIDSFSFAGADDGCCIDADRNSAGTMIDGNGTIRGHDDDGIEADLDAGADGSCCSAAAAVLGQSNATNIDITHNGTITGDDGDGIDHDSDVCCDAANTNTVNISENTGDIRTLSSGDDGIDSEVCCSVSIVTIRDNAGVIHGDDNGIEYSTDISEELSGLGRLGLNVLTISGNNVSNSGDDGINVTNGIYALTNSPTEPLKSVITNNIIDDNGGDGVDLNSVFGINLGPANTISNNGTDANDNGVEIDFGNGSDDFPLTGDDGFPSNEFWFESTGTTLPTDSNRITQNSIFGNKGLGIDLLGADAVGQDDVGPAQTVGCVAYGAAAISPNDCIPSPEITLIAVGGKVGGNACAGCTVELFTADEVPADNALGDPLGRQHGEGKTYLASTTADADGNFSAQLPCPLDAGKLTATATDTNKNTSEFSANAPFLGTVCPTPTPTDTPVPTATNTPVPPTATNTPVPPTPITKPCGDVNDNGSVDAVDAQLILQFSAGLVSTLQNLPSADVNNSGSVNPIDAALILQVEAGLVPLGTLNCG